MDFTDDSLAQKRLQRLQEVERMEAVAMGKACGGSDANTNHHNGNVLVLDTSLRGDGEPGSPTPKMALRRSTTFKADKIMNGRRPSDTEIRSLWRLKVMSQHQ